MNPSDRRIRGIFTPNMVPLDAQGRIDERELRRYVDWLIARGVHGLYPNGSTSEFTRFTAEERRRIVEVVVDQAAGRVPILAGAAEANVRETIAACEHYGSLGVRAVAIVSPFYYRLSPDNVYAYFREIAAHSPVDVTLYNIPMFASPIDLATIIRLADQCERIVGIKDSSGDISQMIRMIDAVRPLRPDFSFLTGWDSALMPMLLIGCDGGTNATSGVVPEWTRRLYDLCVAGRFDEARRLQAKLIQVFDPALYGADFPEGFRAAVAVRGFRMGPGRQPLSERHRALVAEVESKLRRLLDEEGLDTDQAGSTPPPLSREQMQRIVESVVAALGQRRLGDRN